MINTVQKLLDGLNRLIEALFDRNKEKDFPWLPWVWLAGLFAMGVFLWGKFLNWGNIPFDWLDWAEINAPRTAFLKDAITKGVLPLHMPDSSALRGITDRFLCMVDPILSPQVVLLRFMEVGQFFLVHTLLLYTLGAAGLLWFRRKFNLSLVAYTALFLLFNFNGHLLAHYSVGHVTWGGSLLFPWFLVLIFQLLEGDESWAWVAKTSLLLFFIWLQGSFHQYVWGLMFLALIGLTGWREFRQALKTGVCTVLLSMVRILPPAMFASQFDDEFLGGYPTLMDILKSMVTIVYPADAIDIRTMINPFAWWEFDLYLGLVGAFFFLYVGVYRWIKRGAADRGYPALLLPSMVMLVWSVGRIYRVVRLIPIPLLSGERASIRMVLLPFLVLLILGAGEFQHWLDQRKQPLIVRLSELGLLLIMGHDLWQHLKVWQVTNAVSAFPLAKVDLSIKVVANHPDAPYTTALAVGAGITLLTLVFLVVQWVRSSRKTA